jgi:BMFP domain-containing protein YqiC
VVVYLLLSYRRNAAVREEIAFLERRLAELEARSGNPTKP